MMCLECAASLTRQGVGWVCTACGTTYGTPIPLQPEEVIEDNSATVEATRRQEIKNRRLETRLASLESERA